MQSISMDEESVRQFILSHGGRVANTKLVRHYKEELTNPETKAGAIKKLKEIVKGLTKSNELFVIDDKKGSKTLVLRTQSGGHDGSLDSGNSSRPGLQSSMLEALGLLEEKPLGDNDVENMYKSEEAKKPQRSEEQKNSLDLGSSGDSQVRRSSAPSFSAEPCIDSNLSNLDDFLYPVEILNEALQEFEMDENIKGDNYAQGEYVQKEEDIEPDNKLDRSILSIKIDNKVIDDVKGDPSPFLPRLLSPRNKPSHAEGDLPDKQSLWTNEERQKMLNQFHANIEHRHGMRLQTKKSEKTADKDTDTTSQSSSTMSEAEKTWLLISAICDEKQVRKLLDARPELVNYTADVVWGYTALHWASKKGLSNMVTTLHNKYMADLDKKTNSGLTAMHLAYQHGHIDVAGLLHRLGADPNIRDYQSRTPRQYTNNAHNTQYLTARQIHEASKENYRLDASQNKMLGRCNPLRHSWSSLSISSAPYQTSASSSAFTRIGSIKRASSAALKNILRTRRTSWGSAERLDTNVLNSNLRVAKNKHSQLNSVSPNRLAVAATNNSLRDPLTD